MKKLIFWLLAIMIIISIFGCGSPPLALPEQGAKPVEQEPVSTATVAVVESFSNSPLAPPTPIATKTTEETKPAPEVIPTLAGPFPSGPKVVYSENIHDGGVTFWAASPINPAYRTPLAKGSDPNDFGVHAALSPDGKMIAYTALPEWNYDNRLAADLWLVTTDGNEQRLLAEGVDLGGPSYPYWSPDSRYIAFVRSSERSTETEDIYETTAWMIDIITGEEIKVEHPDSNKKSAWPIGWASDGAGFYYRSQGDVYFFSKKTNTSTFIVSLPTSTLGCNLSPDSSQILCSVMTNREKGIYELVTLFLQDRESPKVIKQFQGENFTSLWGPHNQAITISENLPAMESTTLQIIEADTKSAIDLKLQTSGNYFPRSWSPDGTWLAAQSLSESHGDLYFFSNNGQTVNHLPTQGATDVLGWLMIDLSSK